MENINDRKNIELFFESINLLDNVFEGIKQQDFLCRTKEEQLRLEREWLNYCDYYSITESAFFEGFEKAIDQDSLGNKQIKRQYLNHREIIFNQMKQASPNPMQQKERDIFAEKWLKIDIFNQTLKGATEFGYKEGIKFMQKIRISQNLKSLGVDTAIISQATGLSIEEIENL